MTVATDDDIGRRVIGQRIRNTRNNAGITQQALADHLGIPRTAVGQIEDGSRRLGAIEAARAARFLGMDVAVLLGEDPQPGAALARELADLDPADRHAVISYATYRAELTRGTTP